MLPILDNHAHLSPGGRRVAAVREFQEAGGTHLIVSHMPYGLRAILTAEDWRREFETTCSLVDEVNRETDVRAYCVVGPYPVQLIELERSLGLRRAEGLMAEGVGAAAQLVREGRAIGIGEIGRPHFPVSAELMRASNDIMRLCMETAKELDCSVVLHTEHANGSNLAEFSEMARRAGLDPRRVVKHYCGKLEEHWPKGDLSLSVLATKVNVLSALEQGIEFMMETDYLDDPTRPGAVLSLSTVPNRMRWLQKEGRIDEDDWRRIHIDRPLRAYGIDASQ